MLDLVPSFGARRYTIVQDGADMVELRLSWFREAGVVVIDGVPHEIRREGLASGAFTLTRDGEVVARARKSSAFTNRFEVEVDGRHYELARESWWGRAFVLREGDTAVGSIRPHHPLTRRSAIELPADLGLPVQVFLAALVAFMWNRDASAAGGS